MAKFIRENGKEESSKVMESKKDLILTKDSGLIMSSVGLVKLFSKMALSTRVSFKKICHAVKVFMKTIL